MSTSSTQQSPAVLGTGNIKKLLIQYSVPAIIGMMASSLYNIVDSIFIGHGVGGLAISALAITFPFMNLAAAFGALVGVGGATLVSIKMGQQDKEGATDVLGNVIILNATIGILFMIAGLFFLDDILIFFGASENTLPYARDFMKIILYGNVVTHLYFGLNNIMRSSGYPRKAMITTLITVVINIILAPIFIFGFDWGIEGAAMATVFAQIITLIWVAAHFLNTNSFIHFKSGIFNLKGRIVTGIFSIGMAPFVLNACASVVVILINQSLYTHGGDLAIGAYGIINRIIMLFIMIVMGFTQGMQPIAGYNFGAQHYKRVMEVLKLTIICGTFVTTLAFIAGEVFPRQLAIMFTPDETLIELAANGMRIVVAVFPMVGFQMVVSNFFQSIGKAPKAIFLSATRQLLFLIPLILILPNYWGTNGIWWSMPISDLIATFTASILLYLEYKKFKQKMN
jgi:putative MATE family efflux protein